MNMGEFRLENFCITVFIEEIILTMKIFKTKYSILVVAFLFHNNTLQDNLVPFLHIMHGMNGIGTNCVDIWENPRNP